MYNHPYYAKPYFAVMTDNCLNSSAQFRYLNSELLHNTEKDGTLVSPRFGANFKNRWSVYHGISDRSVIVV